jgi:hypothetical protein
MHLWSFWDNCFWFFFLFLLTKEIRKIVEPFFCFSTLNMTNFASSLFWNFCQIFRYHKFERKKMFTDTRIWFMDFIFFNFMGCMVVHTNLSCQKQTKSMLVPCGRLDINHIIFKNVEISKSQFSFFKFGKKPNWYNYPQNDIAKFSYKSI